MEVNALLYALASFEGGYSSLSMRRHRDTSAACTISTDATQGVHHQGHLSSCRSTFLRPVPPRRSIRLGVVVPVGGWREATTAYARRDRWLERQGWQADNGRAR
jgi:hypothetical protein